MLMNNYPGAEYNKQYWNEKDNGEKPQEDGWSSKMTIIFGQGKALEWNEYLGLDAYS